jgi:ribosomal protein L37AE/L43A
MQNDIAVIANITEQGYLAHRTYGTFRIAGRGEEAGGGSAGSAGRGDARSGEGYALTRITGRTAVMDYGDKRTLPLQISAREIAEDICREINSDAGERSFLGVFVCAGLEPTAEELRAAREKLDNFYRALVAAADREWERSHSYLFIHDLQRRAAASLGLDKEWYYRSRETAECPGCGERVKPDVAVCKSCGAVLDREKAVALGIVAVSGTAPAVVGEKIGDAGRPQQRR